MQMVCRAKQALEIGEDIQVIVVSVEPGMVHLEVHAPGRRLTRIDPVALPVEASGLRLAHLEDTSAWPSGFQQRREI